MQASSHSLVLPMNRINYLLSNSHFFPLSRSPSLNHHKMTVIKPRRLLYTRNIFNSASHCKTLKAPSTLVRKAKSISAIALAISPRNEMREISRRIVHEEAYKKWMRLSSYEYDVRMEWLGN